MTAEQIIRALDLKPHPMEGGYFRETWRSTTVLSTRELPSLYSGARSCGTAIYYLLTGAPNGFSALHALPGDEVYHFYLGDPVEMLLLAPDGRSQHKVLGHDVLNGQEMQLVVPGGVWQGSRLKAGGHFALLGATMAPGFDAEDFRLGRREELLERYPEEAEYIRALTR